MTTSTGGWGRVAARARAAVPVPSVRWRRRPLLDRVGDGLRPGDHHYRAYVGPPADYDLIVGIQFGLLLAAGLREGHRLLDVGCGSLRCGRLAIAYLAPDRYFGIEPNKWLVDTGIDAEVGRDLVELKRPVFAHVDDFSAERFGVEFDFAMAQSVFSHTHADLFATALCRVGATLAPEGLLVATFVEGRTEAGSGWVYPGVTAFGWTDVVGFAERSQLHVARLDWPHPRQSWFAAGRAASAAVVEDLARTVRPPRTP